MFPLRITAHLATPIVVNDDFSPNLENLLVYLLLDRHGMACPNPTPADVERSRPIIERYLPLQQGVIGEEWYWQASAPWYFYDWEHQVTIHKRWDKQDQHLDWKGRRRNWSSSEGHTKGYSIILFHRMAHRIDWFCTGEPDRILELLAPCTNLGKKRRGQVIRWQVQASEDHHLWGANGELMKPIPLNCIDRPTNFRIQKWGWREPAWMNENIDTCAMPYQNAVKLHREGLA